MQLVSAAHGYQLALGREADRSIEADRGNKKSLRSMDMPAIQREMLRLHAMILHTMVQQTGLRARECAADSQRWTFVRGVPVC